MESNHLFCRERWLFNRPALSVNVKDGFRLHFHQVGRSYERVFVERVMVDVDREGLRIGSHWSAGQHQIMPGTHLDLPRILVEQACMVWRRCSKLPVFPFARHGTHLCAKLWATPSAFVVRQLIAQRRAVGGHAYDILTHVGSLQLSNLKLSINDHDLIMRDMCNGFFQQWRPKRNFARFRLTAHKPAQQRNPMAIHLARNDD